MPHLGQRYRRGARLTRSLLPFPVARPWAARTGSVQPDRTKTGLQHPHVNGAVQNRPETASIGRFSTRRSKECAPRRANPNGLATGEFTSPFFHCLVGVPMERSLGQLDLERRRGSSPWSMQGRRVSDDFCNRVTPRARTGEPLVPAPDRELHRNGHGPVRACDKPETTQGCVGSGANPRSAPTTQATPASAGGPRADRIGTIEQKPGGEINAIARADPWTPTRPHASASCRENHHSLDRRSPLRAKACNACVATPRPAGDMRQTTEGATACAIREKTHTPS